MQQSGPIDHPPVAAGALADIATLPELWRWRCLRSPDTQAYRHFDSRRGEWTSLSWREIDAVVDRWRQALAADGFGPGERAAILMPNGVAHLAMDQAALSLGLVPVPMHAVDNADSIAYILADCGARLLLHEAALAGRLPAGDVTPELAGRIAVDDDPARSGFAALTDQPVHSERVEIAEEDTATMAAAGSAG